MVEARCPVDLIYMALHFGRKSGIYPGQACVSKRCPYLSGMHLKHMYAQFMIYEEGARSDENGKNLYKHLLSGHTC